MLTDPIIKDKVEELLGKPTPDIYLNVVEKMLESLLGYPITRNDYEERIEGTNSAKLYPKNLPIISVASVAIDEVSAPFSRWDQRTILLETPLQGFYNTYCKNRAVKIPAQVATVAYTAGWTPETFPDDLIYVAYRLLCSKFSTNTAKGLAAYKIDTISYTYLSHEESMSDVVNMLTGYVR